VRQAREHGRRILPIGRGAQLAWCGIPADTDLLISTEHLTGIVSHVPADGTLSARAGTTLAELREVARASGHFLTPDAPNPGAHTLGGVLAAGQSGPDRQRFGPARNHVLGMRVLLADGTLARSGGQLVKNVTGYDLHRLYCGSHGSLCLILEVSLRLFPEPQDELYLEADISGQRELIGCASAVRSSAVRPLSLLVERLSQGDAWRAHLRLAGRPAVLAHERAVLETALPASVALRAELGGAAARAAAERVRDRLWSHRGGPFLRVAGPPSSLPAVLTALGREAPAARPLWVQPDLAEVEVAGDFAPALPALEELAGGRRALAVQVFDAASGPWPTLSAESTGSEMMRALKRRLDPEGLFAREPLA